MGLSMAQYEDIIQKINQGMSDRQIAKSVGKRRSKISEIRQGQFEFNPNEPKLPTWTKEINWENILKDIGLKHPVSLIWEECAKHLTSYSNFTRYLNIKYPQLKISDYTHRQFNPGERVEVDWAGDVVEWIDPVSGKIQKSYIFVGCLGYSQLIFAKAYGSMKEIDFLSAHEAMFEFYGGASEVICPDNTKTAVIKSHKYDPDLNQEYNNFTKHYGITVAPARVYSPKDKALVEGAVKLVQRYFRWLSRRYTFTSLAEINKILKQVIETINNKLHTRFKISRQEMFNLEEKAKLKPLPSVKYELCESKFCKVHPDGTVYVKSRFYSVPFNLVGAEVFVKIFTNTVEIYHKLEQIAVHARLYTHPGARSLHAEHLPEAAQAYRSTTVQFLIQQSAFIDPVFKEFITSQLQENPSGNLRKCQGFVAAARSMKCKVANDVFKEAIIKAVSEMHRFNHYRVEKFKNYLRQHTTEVMHPVPVGDHIKRNHSNPMLKKNQTLH